MQIEHDIQQKVLLLFRYKKKPSLVKPVRVLNELLDCFKIQQFTSIEMKSFPNNKRWTKLFTLDAGMRCSYHDANNETVHGR